MPIVIIAMALCMLAASACVTAEQAVPLSQVMTPEEMKRTGVDQLSPDQQAALSQWLGRWTQSVISQSPSYRQSEDLSQWVNRWPSYEQPNNEEPTPQQQEERGRQNQEVARVLNNGQVIELKNGSVWRVADTYQYVSTQWQRGQRVLISDSGNILFPYWLTNTSIGQQVQAKMQQPASPSGQAAPMPASYYRGAAKLTFVANTGEFVHLGNGTRWRIAPMDTAKVALWRPNDRIRVGASTDFLYKHTLTNLDNGEQALANTTTLSTEKEILNAPY